jgi:hypothetical protein
MYLNIEPLMLGGKRRPRRVFKNNKTGRFYIIVNKTRKYLKPLTKGGRLLRKIADVQRELKHIKASIKPAKQYDEIKGDEEKNTNHEPSIIKHRPKNYESILDISSNYANKTNNDLVPFIKKHSGRPPGAKNKDKSINESLVQPMANDNIIEINEDKHKQDDEIKDATKIRIRRTKTQIQADEQAKNEIIEQAKQKAIQGMGKKLLPPLWSDQITEFFKNQPLFTGTYCIDEITDIPQQIPQGFIINTSKSTDKAGEHWQAIAISDDACMFFDSYGDDPDPIIIKQLKDKFKEWQLPILMKLKINKVALQAPETNTCGFFCIKFLDDIFKGKSFIEATEFNTHNKQGDGRTHNEIQGEATINRQFKLI